MAATVPVDLLGLAFAGLQRRAGAMVIVAVVGAIAIAPTVTATVVVAVVVVPTITVVVIAIVVIAVVPAKTAIVASVAVTIVGQGASQRAEQTERDHRANIRAGIVPIVVIVVIVAIIAVVALAIAEGGVVVVAEIGRRVVVIIQRLGKDGRGGRKGQGQGDAAGEQLFLCRLHGAKNLHRCCSDGVLRAARLERSQESRSQPREAPNRLESREFLRRRGKA